MAAESRELVSNERAVELALEKSPYYRKLNLAGKKVFSQGLLEHLRFLESQQGDPGSSLNWRKYDADTIWQHMQGEVDEDKPRQQQQKHPLTQTLIENFARLKPASSRPFDIIGSAARKAIEIRSVGSQYELDKILGKKATTTGYASQGVTRSSNGRRHN